MRQMAFNIIDLKRGDAFCYMSLYFLPKLEKL